MPDKERLLTAVYELKSLANQPVVSIPWSSPVFATSQGGSLENSPVKLVGYSSIQTPDSTWEAQRVLRCGVQIQCVILSGASKVRNWKRSYSLTPETNRGGAVHGQGELRSVLTHPPGYMFFCAALLRNPARLGMAGAGSRSARSSLVFEGRLRSSVSSPLLAKQVGDFFQTCWVSGSSRFLCSGYDQSIWRGAETRN